MIIVDTDNMQKYVESLADVQAPIAQRVDSLFCLRAFEEVAAIDGLIKAFHIEKKSELLLHEICYCLGQMNRSPEHTAKITEFLEMVIRNDYPPIVIHEAVEALGNMNNYDTLALLKKFEQADSPHTEMVRETVELARDLLMWNQETDHGAKEGLDLKKTRVRTNDPAPPYNLWGDAKWRDVSLVKGIFLDPAQSAFTRNRALFTLREINSKESCLAICESLTPAHFSTCSALLKHEVAFVLAQMEDHYETAYPFLLDACQNPNEASIVKHEGLVAVGEMIDDERIIAGLLEHADPIVSESCAVAINNIRNRLAEQAEWKQRQEQNNSD
jgi:hypothetical protein